MNYIKTTINDFLNESHNFFNSPNDDFLRKRDKEDDLAIRKLHPQAGEYVNFDDEFGDIWHRIAKVYEPLDYFASVYYYDRVNSKTNDTKLAHRFYHNISTICRELPNNARVIYDVDGVLKR